jgi:hypothetical protein
VSITSTSGSVSSSKGHGRFFSVLALAILAGCTEPEPPTRLAGTFTVSGDFQGLTRQSFPCSVSGCTIQSDTTPITGAISGRITFDSIAGSVQSSTATLSLGQCDYCLVSPGSVGNATQVGDSARVFFGGVGRSFQLLGVYRGDSIAGRMEAVESGTVTNTYWGTFTAKPGQRDPQMALMVRGLFDSLKATNGQGDTTTRAGAADSLRGPLTIDDLTTAPLATLTIDKCGAACFGKTVAMPPARNGFTGAGRRNGDSVVFTLSYDLMSRVEFRGLYLGDSITGAMTSSRNTSIATIFSGRFIAKRP